MFIAGNFLSNRRTRSRTHVLNSSSRPANRARKAFIAVYVSTRFVEKQREKIARRGRHVWGMKRRVCRQDVAKDRAAPRDNRIREACATKNHYELAQHRNCEREAHDAEHRSFAVSSKAIFWAPLLTGPMDDGWPYPRIRTTWAAVLTTDTLTIPVVTCVRGSLKASLRLPSESVSTPSTPATGAERLSQSEYMSARLVGRSRAWGVRDAAKCLERMSPGSSGGRGSSEGTASKDGEVRDVASAVRAGAFARRGVYRQTALWSKAHTRKLKENIMAHCRPLPGIRLSHGNT